jgi:hypothetical protein
MSPGTEDERDPDQVRVAIESVRLQLPLIEQSLPTQARQIRDALSQLQMAYVRIGGQQSAGGEAPAPQGQAGEPSPAGPAEDEPPGKPGEAGPAQRSGRLWVPGQ